MAHDVAGKQGSGRSNASKWPGHGGLLMAGLYGMLASGNGVWDLVIFLLILWAVTGLTLVHLGVLGWRGLRRVKERFSRSRPELPVLDTATAPETPFTLTFVVPVYNDGLTVGSCIESMLQQSRRPDRILVVNDGSTDQTHQILEKLRVEKGIDVLHLPENLGKSRAIEAALADVTTDLVTIVDADSVVHEKYVAEILKSFHDPEMAAVGGAVESIPHTWITAARQIEYMITVNVDRNAESTMNTLVVLPGVSTTYRTSVLKEMGFDHDTIAEDFDLTFRMQRAQKKLAMNLRAKVYTSDPPTVESYYRQLMRWYTDFWLVIKKHRSVFGKRLFGKLEVPMLLLNAVVASTLYLVLPVFLVLYDPTRLVWLLGMGLAVDTALVLIAWRVYRRDDVWWAVLSRVPTRIVGRFAFLHAMTRVLIGRPGMAWQKLERRDTSEFLEGRRLLAARTP